MKVKCNFCLSLFFIFLLIIKISAAQILIPATTPKNEAIFSKASIKMNGSMEVFKKTCNALPNSEPNSWCLIPAGWNANPQQTQNGKTLSEIWQPTGRCNSGFTFNASSQTCVPTGTPKACTWGEYWKEEDSTCAITPSTENNFPKCDIKGFYQITEQNKTEWITDESPASSETVYTTIGCNLESNKTNTPQTINQKNIIILCNLKNEALNSQSGWYKCVGPDPITLESTKNIYLNLKHIKTQEDTNNISLTLRTAYASKPNLFIANESKNFIFMKDENNNHSIITYNISSNQAISSNSNNPTLINKQFQAIILPNLQKETASTNTLINAPKVSPLPKAIALNSSAKLNTSNMNSNQNTLSDIPDEPMVPSTVDIGFHQLKIISPSILELNLVNTRQGDLPPTIWNWINSTGTLNLPTLDKFKVYINKIEKKPSAAGFKRTILYAPLKGNVDLKINNWLYLKLETPIPKDATVSVTSSEWPASLNFSNINSDNRTSPTIHVNQVGYDPELPKLAIVGYFLGSLEELDIPSTTFSLIDSQGTNVFSGPLTQRTDSGWKLEKPPYQKVFQADFSNFKNPGQYRIKVDGLGVSYPFKIDRGTTGVFARGYTLGLYHQRCGRSNSLPFTRFTHSECHINPAQIPSVTPEFSFVQNNINGAAKNGFPKDRTLHPAPLMTDTSKSLYPFKKKDTVDVSGGHHDAGDYSKYTHNSARLIHHLVFAADSLPGVVTLDNLGIPESGDGKSDILQIANLEADFLLKMQDTDGGFYTLVYPKTGSYETNVLPDQGWPQVVYPKTTLVTAAATAALAQIASSPSFKKQFPTQATTYLNAAKKGWSFLQSAITASTKALTQIAPSPDALNKLASSPDLHKQFPIEVIIALNNATKKGSTPLQAGINLKAAIKKYGRAGSYQSLYHYGNNFEHNDELAWAATEIFLATGDSTAHNDLLENFDPSSPTTIHWGWEKLYEDYGNAIRSYAFAVKSGRITENKLNSVHYEKCKKEILNGAQAITDWINTNAYATPYPLASKAWNSVGWFFSESFDAVVGFQLNPDREWKKDILSSINFQLGANPNNISFLTGTGWRRPRETVNQYNQNDRRQLPPSGIPLGSLQAGPPGAWWYPYKGLNSLVYPNTNNSYSMYDRWSDSFDLSTEFVVVDLARGLATTSWLMANSSIATQNWKSADAKILGIPQSTKVGLPFTATFSVGGGLDSSKAQIVWEGSNSIPKFGNTFQFIPSVAGPQWIEAEALWPDGRRTFAVFEFSATE